MQDAKTSSFADQEENKILEEDDDVGLQDKDFDQDQNCLSCGMMDWLPQQYDDDNDSRIFIKSDNEVLLFNCINSDSWIHEKIYQKIPNVYYSKTDSIKLEKFIQTENSLTSVVKRKCMLHSSRCETCEILNRQNHRREGNLISTIWDNVTAYPVPGDKFQISHKYTYRPSQQ